MKNWLKRQFSRERIHVAFAADDKFALPATVALYSLFENARYAVTAYLLDAGLTAESRQLLDESLLPLPNGCELKWIVVPMEKIRDLEAGVIASKAAWARVLIPELLPELDRVLYLDSDTIVHTDLKELFELEFGDNYLLAAQDQYGWMGTKMAQLQNLEAHGVRPDAPCFNTGVLLMDLRSWRKERLTEKVISLARRHPEQLHTADQNAINLAFHGRIGMLGPEWNVQPVYRRIRSGEWSDIPTLPRFEGKPKIFHFLSEEKPWLPGCEVPERTHFHRLWQKTKWPVPAFVTAEALPVPVPEPGPRLRKEFPERVPQGD